MRLPSIEMRKRVLHGLVVFVLIYMALIFRVGWIQVVRGDELSDAAMQSRTREISVQARRGMIMDREGRELAVSVDVDSLYAVPAEVRNAGQWAAALAPILGMDERVLRDRLATSASFVWLKRKMAPEAARAVRELDLSGLYFTMESERFYPKGTLASRVLGFAGIDSQGLEGIEMSMDELLRGEPGAISMEFDAEGREIPQAVYHYTPPAEGSNLYLSIDEIIQFIAERELARVVSETEALGAHLLMMDPSTGHILAMASYPNFDLNRWSEVSPVLWRNPLVSDTEHPGSIFKPVTGAAAIEEGVVTPSTPFYDPGYVRVPGAVIHNWNRQGLGAADFALGFAKSTNTIFVRTGLDLGMEAFYRYLYGFGLTEPTGVDLPGEAKGIFPPQDRARPVDLAVMSFGQTLTLTPLQMINSTSAIINGGYLMRPQIIHSIEDAVTGEIRELAPQVIRQVISEETSATIRDLMVNVVEEGTGSLAAISGYGVGGKTGTAQKTVDGVVSRDQHLASFMGFAPASNPAVVCYVVVDEPQGIYYGGQIAAPVFQTVVSETLRYLEITPEFPDEIRGQAPEGVGQPEEVLHQVPDVTGLSVVEAEQILDQRGLEFTRVGTGGEVIEQFPPEGTEVRPGSQVLLYTERLDEEQADVGMVRMPDLMGMSLRTAAEELGVLGLRMEVAGSGIIIRQEPAPRTHVQRGTIVHLYLSSP